MDYEQKYNKLVEAVKVLQETNPSDEGIQNWVNDNVPELAESEDERIRKYLIYCVNRTISESDDFNEISKEQILAWLEKQGEQNPFDYENATIIPKDFAPKVGQKPIWGEEDEVRLQSCLNILQAKGFMGITETINTKWLKSLKQRYTWKPSKEQMHMLRRMITALPPGEVHNGLESLYNDLETLKGE